MQNTAAMLVPVFLVLGLALAGSSSSADPAQAAAAAADRLYVRFDRAVRMPGLILQPGEYLFVLGTPLAGQVIIHTYSARGSKLINTCLAVESRMPRPVRGSLVEYARTDPAALRAWFNPGNAIGFEFVYTPSEAKQIYLASGEPVPFAAASSRVSPETIGTIPVAVSGAAETNAPIAIGTTGSIPRQVDALDPDDHLEAARMAIAGQLGRVDAGLRRRLLLIVELIERVEKAHYAGPRRELRSDLKVALNTISGMLAAGPSRFTGAAPLDAETEVALAKARAHLLAYSSFQS